mmetsp:Transcript_5191/g.14984  ORF Transcript_5191/g.14984 Transcript_5191/m.14984 type:complete len:213 (+) Transcript_5191:136-774(+)
MSGTLDLNNMPKRRGAPGAIRSTFPTAARQQPTPDITLTSSLWGSFLARCSDMNRALSTATCTATHCIDATNNDPSIRIVGVFSQMCTKITINLKRDGIMTATANLDTKSDSTATSKLTPASEPRTTPRTRTACSEKEKIILLQNRSGGSASSSPGGEGSAKKNARYLADSNFRYPSSIAATRAICADRRTADGAFEGRKPAKGSRLNSAWR